MTALFADTFYWVALADSTDSAHQRAVSFTLERATSKIFTTDEVLDGVPELFFSPPNHFGVKPHVVLKAC